jgi:hypothetical protein
MRPDHLLRLDYWLDLAVSAQPAGPAMWLAVAVGALGVVLTGAGLARGRLGRDVAIPWLVTAGLVGLVGLGRLSAHPLLGLRVGWLLAALIAALPLARRALVVLRADGALADCLRALAFAPGGGRGRWGWRAAGAWLGFHLLGLSVVLANLGWPLPLAPLLMIGLSAMPVLAGRRSALATLTPLAFAYAATVLHGLGVRLPGIWNGVLSPLLTLIVATGYGLAIAGWLASGASRRFVVAGAGLLVAAALGWSAWAGWTLRAHGVTGSDPYAYAQMGIDLATRGTVLHPFPLAALAYALNLPIYPTVHVGYRIPDAATLQAATVWPPGYAAFTGLAYRLAGEAGLFLVTPLLNLLALLAAGWFALVAAGRRSPAAFAVAGLTVALTATAYQQVELQMTPMADIAAQLFTVLAIGLALGAQGRGAPLRAALSGLCLGIAFDIRYTQVLLAPAIALALAWGARGFARARLGLVAICAGAAWLAAAPVLAYHWAVFGSPFVTGSDELAHFSPARLPETAGRTLGALGHYREFGLLVPSLAVGLLAAARRSRRALVVALLAFVVLFGFHALYAYLRLRDLLFLFPFLSWLAALGIVTAARAAYWAARRSSRPRAWAALRVGLVGALSVCLVLRAMETLAMPANRGFAAFGHLTAAQRASFDRLRQLTPEDAVIGASLNSGAVELHAGRSAFRPAGWTAEALVRFVDALRAAGRPVFVLDDGEAMGEALRVLRARYGLVEVARLDVPYYDAIGGGSRNRRAPLYRLSSPPRPGE